MGSLQGKRKYSLCGASFSVFTAIQLLLCFDTRVLSLKKLEQSQYQLFGMIKKKKVLALYHIPTVFNLILAKGDSSSSCNETLGGKRALELL